MDAAGRSTRSGSPAATCTCPWAGLMGPRTRLRPDPRPWCD